MFNNLTVFKAAYAMAVHAGQRQAVVSQNVANADTPQYVARDIPDFQDVYAPQETGVHLQRATRSGHLNGANGLQSANLIYEDRSFASPDGNSVSLETEMLRAVDAKRQHDRSLAIYRHGLTVLRASLGRQ